MVVETKRTVEWVEHPDGEAYVMRPVLEGLCSYESLLDGSLDLADIAKMNEHLDIRTENEKRYRKAQQ